MTRKRLQELLDRQTPRVRRRYLAAMQRVRSRATLAKLEDALESGTIATVLDEVERGAALFAAQTEAVTALVANEVAEQLSKKLDVVVTYDGTNERAVAQLRSNRQRVIHAMREEAWEVMADGIKSGTNPREQARAIRDSIGLTPKQAEWVRSYRRRLETLDRGALGMELRDARYDGTVRRAIDEAKPLTAKQIDKLVERYYQRALRYRAEVISRTETMSAVHAGQHEAYQQAIDDGTLDADLAIQTWPGTRR